MPRLLIIGAHPDDAEFGAGGLIAKYTGAGYAVKAITVTNGNAGHYAVPPADLAKRRHAEARAAADKGGFEIEVWDNPDAQLAPTIIIPTIAPRVNSSRMHRIWFACRISIEIRRLPRRGPWWRA